MNAYHTKVAEAARALQYVSGLSFLWFGSRVRFIRRERSLPFELRQELLVAAMRDILYANFYCTGYARPLQIENVGATGLEGNHLFIEKLSQANKGTGCLERGGMVESIESPWINIFHKGLRLRVYQGDCVIADNLDISEGVEVGLRLPKELRNVSPGYYMALGNKPLGQADGSSLVRVYFNLSPEGAVHFLEFCSETLNRYMYPYRIKILNDLSRFYRCDAAVLYIEKAHYLPICEILEKSYHSFVRWLEKRTPVFTKTLAAGIGLAEEPNKGESFGQNRCRMLAEALFEAYKQDKKSLNEQLDLVRQRFALEGVSLEEPFLNDGSKDQYDFRPKIQAHYNRKYPNKKRPSFLRMAQGIGQRVCQEAIWYGGACNWIAVGPTSGGPSLSALGPEVYSGTSGIALFLGELHAVSGDSIFKHTALAAIRHALSQCDRWPRNSCIGLYTGMLGIAYAAIRLSRCFDEDELLIRAQTLIQRALRAQLRSIDFDLMSGSAGAIVALVALGRFINDEKILKFAIQLGEKLLLSSIEGEGRSWKSPSSPKDQNLTGFSHGTAGVGYCLVELFRATRRLKYARAAREAFDYESTWFNRDVGNWPDFRGVLRAGPNTKDLIPCSIAWCHGAPGIALSRLRAYEILGTERWKEEAIIGLHTTHASLSSVPGSQPHNFSLCHGLAGNAEVLFTGSTVLGSEFSVGAERALQIGQYVIDVAPAWGLETPGLMVGLSGMGYFFLRLHSSATPSILIL